MKLQHIAMFQQERVLEVEYLGVGHKAEQRRRISQEIRCLAMVVHAYSKKLI